MGATGQDNAADMVVEMLTKEGVGFSIHEDKDVSTGLCALTVNNADRTSIAILDACEKYPTEHMVKMMQ